MLNLRQAILAVAATYRAAVAENGGKSLARVSTIVLNQGGFFRQLEEGKGCTVASFEAVMGWFAKPENWPGASIPKPADDVLQALIAIPVVAE